MAVIEYGDDTRLVAFAGNHDSPADAFQAAAEWLRKHPCGVVGVAMVYHSDDGGYELQVVGTFDDGEATP